MTNENSIVNSCYFHTLFFENWNQSPMKARRYNNQFFIQLDAGEQLVASLKIIAEQHSIRVAAITCGVGMINGVEMGFFCIPKDDYDRTVINGIHDVSSITGNITWMNDKPIPHVHMTFNNSEYQTFSGHIIEATCHITMEIFVDVINELSIDRKKFSGRPATQIAFTEQ